jgi:UDP-N-acetylmuramoyl-tripeptide--D-alanyl-D-alanine ligase
VVLINDCYNANPMSMRAAIEDLGDTAPGRRVAVLGDMLELGAGSDGLHREIGAAAAQAGVEVLLAVGPLAQAMRATFTGDSHGAPDARAAAELLAGVIEPGDTVLVKGSRGVGLEVVADALTAGRGRS